jgi:hypothetical protein
LLIDLFSVATPKPSIVKQSKNKIILHKMEQKPEQHNIKSQAHLKPTVKEDPSTSRKASVSKPNSRSRSPKT